MDLPAAIIIIDGAFATDGGSISLLVSDTEGQRHEILLTQHLLLPSGYPGERKTGRLYFDGSIVAVRSDQERSLISMLKSAEMEVPSPEGEHPGIISRDQPGMIVGDDIAAYYSKIEEGPEAALRHLVQALIDYVESPEYVTYAESHR
jgi:hypothetical protein